MAVRIIDQDEKYLRTCDCKACGALLEFNIFSDVIDGEKQKGSPAPAGYVFSRHIICPQCGTRLPIKP